MRRLGALLLWTIVAFLLPAVAFAEGGTGVDSLGPGLGAWYMLFSIYILRNAGQSPLPLSSAAPSD